MINRWPQESAAASCPMELYAVEQWTAVVARALRAPHDLPTVAAWAREAGICETQLRLRCRLVGVAAKASLDLVRVTRAVYCRNRWGGTLDDYLHVSDGRTIERLFRRVCVRIEEVRSPNDLVAQQRVLLSDRLKRALEQACPPFSR